VPREGRALLQVFTGRLWPEMSVQKPGGERAVSPSSWAGRLSRTGKKDLPSNDVAPISLPLVRNSCGLLAISGRVADAGNGTVGRTNQPTSATRFATGATAVESPTGPRHTLSIRRIVCGGSWSGGGSKARSRWHSLERALWRCVHVTDWNFTRRATSITSGPATAGI